MKRIDFSKVLPKCFGIVGELYQNPTSNKLFININLEEQL